MRRRIHHWVTHGYARYTMVLWERVRTPLGDPDPRILWCYRNSGRGLCALYTPWVSHVYYGAIGTLGEGYVRCTPLGDPRVCHVYYGAIGTLGEGLCALYTIG